MPDRHPLGRTCRGMLPLAVLLMPYALIRYALSTTSRRRTTVEVTTPPRAGEGTNSNGHPHGCQCPSCGNRCG